MIDDETIVADTLAMVLNSSGFDAVAAYSGESALELARQSSFDHLVTDVMMEPMNGIQLALAVSHLHPKCRVLLLSGHEHTAHLLQEAIDSGYEFNILAKPVHPNIILDHLRVGEPPADPSPSALGN